MTIQSLSKVLLFALAFPAFKVQAQSSSENRMNQHAAVYISPLVISSRTFGLLPRIYGGRYYVNEKLQLISSTSKQIRVEDSLKAGKHH